MEAHKQNLLYLGQEQKVLFNLKIHGECFYVSLPLFIECFWGKVLLNIFRKHFLNGKSSKNAILNPYEYNLLPSNLSWSFHTFIFFSICVCTLFDKSWNLFISENIIYQAPEIKTWYIMFFSYISYIKYGKK